MTLCAFGANTGQKRLNMVAILKFKMAAEDNLEKNGSNSDFVLKGIWKVKSIGSTSIANFALDYITPCTRRRMESSSVLWLPTEDHKLASGLVQQIKQCCKSQWRFD